MTSSSVFAVLVASLTVLVSAQIPSLGWCPDYLPMADFDMDRFLGKWYEAERYFTISEVASRCVVTDYARSSNGRIYISNEVTNRITGIKRIIGGNLELAGKGTEGKMNVKYSTTPLSTESTLTVLDTDYDNYAVIWSCSGIGPIHTENAWLMTRERLAPGAVLQRAYGVLDKFKISRTFFVKTDQEGCAIVAADINASHGITPASTVPQAVGSELKSANRSHLKEDESNVSEFEQDKKIPEKSEKPKVETVAEHILNNVDEKESEKVSEESQDDMEVSS